MKNFPENKNKDIKVQNNITEKIKRSPTQDDILNFLQVIELENKKIFTQIVVNPIKKRIVVKNFDNQKKFTSNNNFSNNKSLEAIYNYGGIKLLLNTINKASTSPTQISKYLIIKTQNNLTEILDVLGSVYLDNNLKSKLKINQEKFIGNILDSETFLNLLSSGNSQTAEKLIQEVYLQKIYLFEQESGEELFKKTINKTESNFSFKDFLKFSELDLSNF